MGVEIPYLDARTVPYSTVVFNLSDFDARPIAYILCQSKGTDAHHDVCKENRIYILKNQIIVENLENIGLNYREKEINKFESFDNNNEKRINKKRKRDETFEEDNVKNIKIFKRNDNFLFNNSFFDENRKVILRHINILSC